MLLDAPQLKQVRTIYAFANPVAKWLLVVVGCCIWARSCCPGAGRG